MVGVRFLISGIILFAWARLRGAQSPTRLQWRNTAIIGACLLLGGNGAVVWAEQVVPSGLTALLVAILPFWIVLIDWVRPGGKRPSFGIAVGLIVGLIGLVVLIGPSALHPGADTGNGNGVKLIGAITLMLGSLSWALGSIYSKHADLPKSAILATGMEMISGGALLLTASLILREPTHFDPAGVSARSIAGFIYLTTIGSLVGFTAFV
jgi:drug/metabolite transporter (DMT)-like permease